MIPSKEAKTITYELLENSYIQLQELRKTISASAPSKSVYLYYVDMGGLARTQLTRVYQVNLGVKYQKYKLLLAIYMIRK